MKYTGEYLSEINFPLGGIGTGSIGLCGNGEFMDWEIFNRPNKGSVNPYTHFSVKAQYPDGKTVVKVLQGDHIRDLMGQYCRSRWHGFGYGPDSRIMAGYAHFKNVSFDGKFPIATLTFEDEGFPARVVMRALSPFIPLNADDSSIPAALFEISFEDTLPDVRYTTVLSVGNPYQPCRNRVLTDKSYTAVQLLQAGDDPSDKDYGDMTVAVMGEDAFCQEYWYRGSWQDSVTSFWREWCEGDLPARHYDEEGKYDTASVGASGEKLRFIISWNNPNCWHHWNPRQDENGKDIVWKNYYSTLFADSTASAEYCFNNWERLVGQTALFGEVLHRSSIDETALDALSSHLSVLRTATVLRLEDGRFYGWEGVHELEGSCEGTCTHVWSYAYALCFLFPELERSLRDTELLIDTDEDGKMQFRTALPLTAPRMDFHPCLDGQMATLIKVYRDWKISGDDEWLKKLWPQLKNVLQYAWSDKNDYEWDRDRDGVLEGRQHHTLDMELFGPSGWLQGLYLAALKAGALMAEYLGESDTAADYLALFENGRRYTEEHLFNGEYYIQKVDVCDKSPADHFNCQNYWNDEKGQLKYQIAEGCEIDQLLGQWHADICGLGDIFDKDNRKVALQNLMKNNFKPSMREVTNMWRVFALNDEAGTIMCDYPEGKEKPVIPISYCEECMTGFEYALAGLMIAEGMEKEGLTLIRAIRDRYDGKKRNPYNEIECGSNYARPMASFALLPIYAGFDYDLPHGHIGFAPIVKGDFNALWSVGTGWGEYKRTDKEHRITLCDGELKLTSLSLPDTVKTLTVDGAPVSFEIRDGKLLFAPLTATKEIVATL